MLGSWKCDIGAANALTGCRAENSKEKENFSFSRANHFLIQQGKQMAKNP
jgi:hypothetical protein